MIKAWLHEYERNDVVMDNEYNFGRPMFADNKVPLLPIIERIRAGDRAKYMIEEFGITRDQLDEIMEVEMRNPGYTERFEDAYDMYQSVLFSGEEYLKMQKLMAVEGDTDEL